MKKLLIYIAAALIALPMLAQNNKENKGGNNKQAPASRIETTLSNIKDRQILTDEEFEAFAPIFKEYAAKRALLNKQKRDNRQVTENITEEQAKEMLENINKLDAQKAELKKEYTSKMLEVVPAKKLLQLQMMNAQYRAHRMHNCQNPETCPKGREE